MRGKVRRLRLRRLAGIIMILICTAVLTNCGWFEGGDEAAAPAPPPSGVVVQGPVSGAFVYADHNDGSAQANGVFDTGEINTVSAMDGKFTYPSTPGYAYISRSTGGTDTLTNKPAVPMAAPSGVNTITPITTMVALTPPAQQAAMITKLESIMGGASYASDPSVKATPAALALNRSIETAMSVLSTTVQSAAGAGAITTTQLNKIQTTVATAIATELAKPTTTTATLTNVSTGIDNLATMVDTATKAAVPTINANNANIAIANVTTISAAVKTAVQEVATSIATQAGTSAANMSVSAASAVAEATIVQPIVKTISASMNNAANTSVQSVAAVSTGIDVVAPAVTAVTPADTATAVPVKSSVTITFTKTMDPATLTSTNFSLSVTGGAAVTATISYDSVSKTAILTPTADLSASTSYTATCTTGAMDLKAKLGIAANRVWSFTTAAAPDLTPPTVTVTPADVATGVAVGTNIVAAFNKTINPATLTTTTFSVKTTVGSVPVDGTVRYDASLNQATFLPGIPLSFSTSYTVTLTSGITSTSGGALATTTTTFTTVASADTTKPNATLTIAKDANDRVRINFGRVVATFTEQMDITTINNGTFFMKFQSDGGGVAGTVIYNTTNFTATFIPRDPLGNGRIYTATLTTGAKDEAGNTLEQEKTLTFATEGVPTGSTGGTPF